LTNAGIKDIILYYIQALSGREKTMYSYDISLHPYILSIRTVSRPLGLTGLASASLSEPNKQDAAAGTAGV